MDAAYVKQRFHYDPVTGIFTWKINRYRARIGDKAGYTAKNGYVTLRIDQKNYLAHRIAWLYVYGELPKLNIDHKDGNPSNNAISNLRLATQSQNCANARIDRRNKYGVKGVCFDNSRKLWLAYIDGEHLGRFPSFEEAARVREAEAIKRHKEFVRFA